MNTQELREQWIKENPAKYGEPRCNFEKPIYTKSECCGHGDYRDIEYSNVDYTKWLEEKLTSDNSDYEATPKSCLGCMGTGRIMGTAEKCTLCGGSGEDTA
jgi:hypothetical protein